MLSTLIGVRMKELRKILELGASLSSRNLMGEIVPIVTGIYCGWLGSKHLAAASIGIMWAWCTGHGMIEGLSCAAETLTAQATGAGNNRLAQAHLVVGITTMVLFAIATSFAWWIWAENLAGFVGGGDQSELVGQYLRWSAIGLVPTAIHVVLGKYILAQGDPNPSIIAMIVSTSSFFILLYIADTVLNMGGLRGVGLANAGAECTNCIVMLWYAYPTLIEVAKRPPPLTGHWNEFAQLAVPAGVAYASEEWSFQVGIVMASLVGSDAASAHAVALNIHLFTNTCFGRSFGETAVTLVGNMLGAGDWVGARRVGVGIVWLSFFATAICSVMTLLLDTTAALIWSTDGVVLLEYSMIVPMVALVLTVDNCACVMQGVLAACGYQQWGAACYLLGCTCLGVPLGWYLTFTAELGLVGLWIGTLFGMCASILMLGLVVLRLNWKTVSQRVIAEAEAEDE